MHVDSTAKMEIGIGVSYIHHFMKSVCYTVHLQTVVKLLAARKASIYAVSIFHESITKVSDRHSFIMFTG